jgi:hypothetical protein
MLKYLNDLLANQARKPGTSHRSVAGNLMDRAEASAGTDPYRAAELRRAALAYLGVVR